MPPGRLASTVGIVFQDPARQIVMDRVEDDVAFGLESLAWDPTRMHDRVPEALAAVGLGGSERRVASELSGGGRQRLALAGAMAPEPAVLVLDEPSANLDPTGVTDTADLIAAAKAAGATVVLVEHRVETAWPVADLVLALGPDGRPMAFGTPSTVLERRRDLEGVGTWLPGTVTPRLPPRPAGAGTAAAPATLLRLTDVGFGYEPARPVLRDLSLTVHAGERVALVGPNGGGKSTLAKIMVGLLRADHGRVELDGSDPARIPARDLARLAGYVFQEPERQFLTNRVADEIALGLDAEARARVPTLMSALSLPLDDFGGRSPYALSGGEARRLSLATALVRRPRVLVLDEPTFGQDARSYAGLIGDLRDHLGTGTTLIAATHDERFVADVAERVIRLDDGVVTADDVVTTDAAGRARAARSDLR